MLWHAAAISGTLLKAGKSATAKTVKIKLTG
jgi:hypothetical protein